MVKQLIKIEGANSEYLTVSLVDILHCINDRQANRWSILNIYNAYWDADKNGSILDFEKRVNESEKGLLLTWEELIRLTEKFNYITEILIISDKNVSSLKRYSNDEEMYQSCSCVIELVDSSYWLVNAYKEDIECIKNKLEGVNMLE